MSGNWRDEKHRVSLYPLDSSADLPGETRGEYGAILHLNIPVPPNNPIRVHSPMAEDPS